MKLLFVLAVVGLIVAAIFWWRALIDRRRERFIDACPYGKFLDRRLAARRPALSAAQRAQVFAGLCEYFQLCRQAKKRLVAMPSQVVERRLRWGRLRRRLKAPPGPERDQLRSDAVLLEPRLHASPAILGFVLAVAWPVVAVKGMRHAVVDTDR